MTKSCWRRRAVALGSIVMLCALVSLAPTARAEPPDVVASIKPLHSLVASVMAGVAEPHLLIRSAASPHTYSLRPSDARALEMADMVFYVAPGLETMLLNAIVQSSRPGRSAAAIEAPGITRYPIRRAGIWAGNGAEERERHGHSTEWDPHIWLDPSNAVAIVDRTASALAERDPGNAARYKENRDRTVARLNALDAEIDARFAPVRNLFFVVFHDAFQYLERRYRLSAAGTITISPEQRPGPRRLTRIRRFILDHDVRCVFIEPQFPDGTARIVVEGTGARIATLDPLGYDIAAGPDAYFQLMRDIAANVAGCLGGGTE